MMDLPVLVETKTIQMKHPNISIQYPIFKNFPNAAVQQKMNIKIISTLNEMLLAQNYHSPDLVELVANYEIKTNERGVFSLNLTVYNFTGGAHGMTVVQSLNFDTSTGDVIPLSQLFKSNKAYIDIVNEYIRKKINEWEIDVIEPFKTITSDQDFYISDHTIVFYFQLYELAPYSSGFPYFPIPLLDLQKQIAPNSLLDRLLPFT